MAGVVEKDGVKTVDVLAIKPIAIDIDVTSIPCVDLKTEYDAYISLGRNEKAVLIRSAIENSNKQ